VAVLVVAARRLDLSPAAVAILNTRRQSTSMKGKIDRLIPTLDFNHETTSSRSRVQRDYCRGLFFVYDVFVFGGHSIGCFCEEGVRNDDAVEV
jgi:hypothetical protein